MAEGWEANPLLVVRALQLTAADPSLPLSLPVIRGADEQTTLGVVLGLLADLGLGGETCADVVIDSRLRGACLWSGRPSPSGITCWERVA